MVRLDLVGDKWVPDDDWALYWPTRDGIGFDAEAAEASLPLTRPQLVAPDGTMVLLGGWSFCDGE